MSDVRPPDVENDPERRNFVDDFVGETSDQLTTKEREAEAQKELEDKLQVLGNGIEAEAEEFERLRRPKELQMLEDMRQYQGVEDNIDRLNKKVNTTGSTLNVNITRKKTNAAEARLSDMLFPTDDKNWGIAPSPIPKVAVKGLPPSAPNQPQLPPPQPAAVQQGPEQGMMELPPAGQEMSGSGQTLSGVPGQGPAPQEMAPDQVLTAQEAQASPVPTPLTPEEETERDAKARAGLMESEMDDQLGQCNYNAHGREAIRLGCLLGTGVLKGPVRMGKGRRAWIKKEDELGNVAYVLKEVQDDSPGFELVSTWDFFPTMSATKIEDSEVTFQRHWMTRRDLIRLAKREDFMKDQIRKVLHNSPNRIPPDYLTQLRNMSEVTSVGDEKRYVVWERHGPVESTALQACGVLEPDVEIDPLDEFHGIVWVCQGIVIKAAINPMDTEDQPFSVFNFEKDDSSIFGYGVPYLMRQPAEVVKKSWRMIMDNAGLSVGGQIIINKSIVEPAQTPDGKHSWDITPLKVWLLKDKHAKAAEAFHIFEFPNHQKELAAIFNMAREMADEETGIPLIAEGEQGNASMGAQTAHGMEMLMNNHNIVMRRAVKNWDDNQTIPNITRLYDHNMQNNPNNDIKGDYQPVAKGSSALLQKETQSRNMLNLVNFLMTPAFAGWVRQEATVRKLVSSMQHDPDELIKTKAEYDVDAKAAQEAAAQNQPPGNNNVEIQRMRNDLAYKIHQDKLLDTAAEREFKGLLADKEHETEVMKLAQAKDMTIAQIAAQLEAIHAKSQADRTLMADKLESALALPAGKVAG
jgi:hypothetical protein